MTTLEQTECPECSQIVHYQPQRWKAQVVCSNCQATFPVEAVQPPSLPGAEPSPIPSHLQKESGPPELTEPSASETKESETFRYQRSKVGGVMMTAILIVLIAGGVVGGIVGLAMLDKNSTDNKKAERERKEEANKKIDYTLAGKKRVKLGDLEVGVKLVEFGPVRVKDQTNKVHVSSEQLLQVYLEIRSRRSSDVEYVSWYGNSFARGDDRVVAELTDQDGRSCDMPVYGDVKGLFGHTPQAVIARNERIQDCIIFELPKNTTVTDIKELRLSLPMECFGNEGNLYFKIPQELITLVSDDSGDE